jgi:co-chaperonin GroES (HSP10)
VGYQTQQENKLSKVHIHKFKGDVKAIGESVLVTNMYFGEEKTAGGIIQLNDNGKVQGIKARWCQVYDIGPRSKLKDVINVGDWIMLEHGRWSRQVLVEDNEGQDWVIQKADTDAILLVSQDQPAEVDSWLSLKQEMKSVKKEQRPSFV